ncbi:MAG: class I SAM-dependent methyltransferase [Gammaproteobacteria bacterium]|nr:class I SAM-dependent methyltransferase [Gammaproteobacteria bacterium]
MNPADDPCTDYRALVRTSYDRLAPAYAESRVGEVHPELEWLLTRLDHGSSVLDIGCGAGVPVTQSLAKRFVVTGVDVSKEMVRLARANVPNANFVRSDIMSVEFDDSTFDAAVAFFSLFHIPREDHPRLFRRIRDWLKPGGYLMCTLSLDSETGYTEDDFFGSKMYWSNYGLSEYEEMLTGIGFTMLATKVIDHGLAEATYASSEQHPLVLVRRA